MDYMLLFVNKKIIVCCTCIKNFNLSLLNFPECMYVKVKIVV